MTPLVELLENLGEGKMVHHHVAADLVQASVQLRTPRTTAVGNGIITEQITQMVYGQRRQANGRSSMIAVRS